MGRPEMPSEQLPNRLYLRSGTYYFVERHADRWINLGSDYRKAMIAYERLAAESKP